MKVFVDTSALFALLDADDRFHASAAAEFERLMDARAVLVTTNYILLETAALVQSRLGMEALTTFEYDVRPALTVTWIDEDRHRSAVNALIAANRRALSLVDMCSFAVMRDEDIERVFAFDTHFAEQGFSVVPV